MNKVISLARHTSPLCFLPDGKLVCYHCGHVVVYADKEVVLRISLFNTFKERFLGRSRLLTRLLRLGIRTAIAISSTSILFSIGCYLYELDLNTKVLSKGFKCGDGIRPLIFTHVNGIEGFKDGFYFGGYVINKMKTPIYVYHRISTDQWEAIYTFEQGTINHIHNIVPDPYRQCLWIFTGDFDEASAIWKVEDGFSKIECIASNNQKYRACVAYALPEGLLYATDTPFADDYIYLMDPGTYIVEELHSIHGSCIYGCKWRDKYVFSSTVEGDGRNVTLWSFLFSCKRGSGIKDQYIHMYYGDLQGGFKEVYKETKDYLPFGPFQFGVFKFPLGENNSRTLYFQPIATMNNDQVLMAITL